MAGRQREVPRLFADYGYVRRDLARIAVLAVSMFIVLLVLSFVIPMWVK
jgi:hypothetical protein